MKIDLEAKYENNLVNNASDINRLSSESTTKSTGITLFDKSKTIYIADDFSDKKEITIQLQDFVDIIKQEVLIDCLELMKSKLDDTFLDPTPLAGAPLSAFWVARSLLIQVEIDDAKIKLNNQKQVFKDIEDNLK